MSKKVSRFVPYATGIFWVSVSLGILLVWREPTGFMYWVRNGLTFLPLFFGLNSLRRAIFASDEEIEGLMKTSAPPKPTKAQGNAAAEQALFQELMAAQSSPEEDRAFVLEMLQECGTVLDENDAAFLKEMRRKKLL